MADKLTQAERAVAEDLKGEIDPLSLFRIATVTKDDHDWGLHGQSHAIYALAIRQQERIQIAEDALKSVHAWMVDDLSPDPSMHPVMAIVVEALARMAEEKR